MSKTGEDETKNADDIANEIALTAEAMVEPVNQLIFLDIHNHDNSARYAVHNESNDDIFLCASVEIAISKALSSLEKVIGECAECDEHDLESISEELQSDLQCELIIGCDTYTINIILVDPNAAPVVKIGSFGHNYDL